MTTTVSPAGTGTRATGAFHPSFSFWMTVVMALFVLSGFALTYWIPMARGSLAPLPPVAHLHGAFFFSWTASYPVIGSAAMRRRFLGVIALGIV